ncbi:hypothetical protein VTJ49DRAFT_1480 [Mycothermus thermophilus]|uniref:RRM domain-containing protein n=1 Tax=Humicola insolens TaxID=85995 RepID=A0ABR3VDJ3_HUMIN
MEALSLSHHWTFRIIEDAKRTLYQLSHTPERSLLNLPRRSQVLHSIRGAALRSLVAASRTAAAPARILPAAARIAQHDAASRLVAPHTIRFFTQTPARTSEAERAQEESEQPLEEVQDLKENIAQTEVNVQEAMQEMSPPTSSAEPTEGGQKEIKAGFSAFVRNLVFELTEEHLEKAFSKYGNVMKTFIARDPRGLSKGYGFVQFETEEALKAACDSVNGSFWHGRRITCIPRTDKRDGLSGGPGRHPRSPTEPTSQLFIGNIPYETTDAELNRLFKGIDNLESVRVAVDRTTGWPRGFAHADFTSVEAATEAKRRLEGVVLGDRALRIDYAEGFQKSRDGGSRRDGGGRRDGGRRRESRSSSDDINGDAEF